MVASLLHHYGYFAVAAILLLENIGVPFPGEAILIAAAVSAGNGDLNVFGVAIVAIVSAVAGSSIGYAIGARGGRALLERYGKWVRLTPARLDKVEDFMNRRGVPLIIFGRYIEGVRQFCGLIAGFSEMTWQKFVGSTALGAVIWVSTWVSIGYFAGNHVDTIEKYGTYFAVAALVAVIGFFVIRWLRRRSEATA